MRPSGLGHRIALDRGQANYLLNVLRLKAGESVLVFNGRDGEWRAEVVGGGPQGRRSRLRASGPGSRTGRPTSSMPSRPLKHARLDYMVQKAVEMGAGVLQPVLTRRTQSTRVNLERMRANAIEAAEQCGILSIPEVREEENLERFLKGLEPERLVVFCDEDAPVSNPVEALGQAWEQQEPGLSLSWAPKEGFTDRRERLSPPTKDVFAYRWDRESCAPTQPLWPHWPSFSPCSAIGPDLTARQRLKPDLPVASKA